MPRPAALIVGASLLAVAVAGPASPSTASPDTAATERSGAPVAAPSPEGAEHADPEAGRTFAEPVSLVRAPAGRLPPRPPEVVPAPETSGDLVVHPPVTWVDGAPGEDLQPEFTLTNGSGQELGIVLAARSVAPDDDDGAPAATDERAGATEWLDLLVPEVGLRDGERAHVWPTITVPDGTVAGNYALAITGDARVVSRGGGQVTTGDEVARVEALLVVSVAQPDVAPPQPTGPQLELRTRLRGSAVRLTLRTEAGVTAVTGHVRLRGWFSRSTATADVPPEVILPGTTRQVDVGVRPPLLPGRYTATAALTTPDGGRLELRAAGWLWHPAVAVATATLLIAAAAIVLSRTRRSAGS